MEYDLGVRVNALDTDFWQEDLESCLSAKHLPDTVLIPKVENSDIVRQVSRK